MNNPVCAKIIFSLCQTVFYLVFLKLEPPKEPFDAFCMILIGVTFLIEPRVSQIVIYPKMSLLARRKEELQSYKELQQQLNLFFNTLNDNNKIIVASEQMMITFLLLRLNN